MSATSCWTPSSSSASARALALEALEALRGIGFHLSDHQIRDGLRRTAWRGRFTTLQTDPRIIIDGAHNPGAAQELRDSLQTYFPDRTLYYIMGMFKDKDYRKVIELTVPLARHVITVETPNNPRALPAEALRDAVAVLDPTAECADSIAQAVSKAQSLAKPEDVIVIFGSLSFLGEAAAAVEKEGKH